MTTIDTSTNVFDQINKANQQNEQTQSQAQQDSDMFMQLMIAQLQNQDPTSPTDTNAFMEQIATMNQVESTNNLVNAVNQMSADLSVSQSALQASSMVGQSAYTKTDSVFANSQGVIKGYYSLPTNASGVFVTVRDSTGQVVEEFDAGNKAAGEHEFVWQGEDAASKKYTIEIHTPDENGTMQQVDTYLASTVTSVTLGQNGVGMTVNTSDGQLAMSDITRVGL